MYLSNMEEEDHHGSRGSSLVHQHHCGGDGTTTSSAEGGQPVTPDSVVGTNLLLEQRGMCGGDGDGPNNIAQHHQHQHHQHQHEHHHEQQHNNKHYEHDEQYPSPELLSIFETESNERYEVSPNYLHSSVLMMPSSSSSSMAAARGVAVVDSKDQGVSERCRRRTCEWMYDICDYFQLNREVVGIALFYVDRYFTITFEGGGGGGAGAGGAGAGAGGGAASPSNNNDGRRHQQQQFRHQGRQQQHQGRQQLHQQHQQQVPVTRREFQLVALTGLYIAVKLHGESRQENLVSRATTTAAGGRNSSSPGGAGGPPSSGPPHTSRSNVQPWNRLKFTLAVCASISRNQFTTYEIEECERDMLHTLDWHVNPVVSSGTVIDSLLAYLPTTLLMMMDGVGGVGVGGGTGMPGMDDTTTTTIESLSLYVYDCAKYLAELSVSVPALSLVYKPSVVAYASISHAIDTLVMSSSYKSSSMPSDSPSSSSSCPMIITERGRLLKEYYEEHVHRATSRRFEREVEDVESAKGILRAICPNLHELFPPPPPPTMMMTTNMMMTTTSSSSPSLDPLGSPTSVNLS